MNNEFVDLPCLQSILTGSQPLSPPPTPRPSQAAQHVRATDDVVCGLLLVVVHGLSSTHHSAGCPTATLSSAITVWGVAGLPTSHNTKNRNPLRRIDRRRAEQGSPSLHPDLGATYGRIDSARPLVGASHLCLRAREKWQEPEQARRLLID